MPRIIDFIESQDAVGFKEIFDETMQSKVVNTLEDEKVAVAQKFFGEAEEKKDDKKLDADDHVEGGVAGAKVSDKAKKAAKTGVGAGGGGGA